MSLLLQARFTSTGPTNADIMNLGSVKFDENSRIYNADKSAYFPPCDDKAGLQIKGTTLSKIYTYLSNADSSYSIYFKFKIDLRDSSSANPIPILSYVEPVTNEPANWLNIEDNSRFVYYFNNNFFVSTLDCSWIFDDNWHTFYMNKYINRVQFFIDGFAINVCSIPTTSYVNMDHSNTIYIGLKAQAKNQDHHYYTIQNGYLDDICISNTLVYYNTFIVPNQYWTGMDNDDNYFKGIRDNTVYMPKDLADFTYTRMLSSTSKIKESQQNLIPRRLTIQWKEEDHVVYNQELYKIKTGNYTAFTFNGLGQQLLMEPNSTEFVDMLNAKDGVEDKVLYPFLLFIDHIYMNLSNIYIIKSNSNLTLFIDERATDKLDRRAKTVELVLLPFNCIYEEDEPFRIDYPLLYSFNKEGYFDKYNAYYVYYLDTTLSPEIGCLPDILEEYVEPTTLLDEEKINKKRIYNSKWRQGYFTIVETTARDIKLSFTSTSNSYTAQVGDGVVLYNNKTNQLTKPSYKIIGTDLFAFNTTDPKDVEEYLGVFVTELDEQGNEVRKLVQKRPITMQVIKRDPVDLYGGGSVLTLYDKITEMKPVIVTIEEPFQKSVTIPSLTKTDNMRYDSFLVFKNGISMNDKGRYAISLDKKSIRFTHQSDILQKGDKLLFLFLHVGISDQYGPLHCVPTYLGTRTGANKVPISKGRVTEIRIPPYREVTFTKNNIFFFVNGTLIDPSRYDIEDGYVKMRKDLNNTSKGEPGFTIGKEVLFVFLKILNELEDPTGYRGEIMRDQMRRGSRFILYDLNIDKKVKITMDNLLVFDNKGRFMSEVMGEIYNMNIIKALKSSTNPNEWIPRYVTCVYSKDTLANEANITRFNNDDYIKDYIKLYQEIYELDEDFQLLLKDYDIDLDPDNPYSKNLMQAYYASMQYNQSLYLDLYNQRCTVKRDTIDIEKFNQMLKDYIPNHPAYITDSSQDLAHRNYVIYFENGIIPDWYGSIKYSSTDYSLELKDFLKPSSSLEKFTFMNRNNTLVKLNSKIT